MEAERSSATLLIHLQIYEETCPGSKDTSRVGR